MKIRTDFVTNSSSSSFVISNKKFSTKEEVFQKIKELYREYHEKVKEVIDYCKTDKRFKVEHKDDYFHLSINQKTAGKPPYFEIWDELEEKFGIEMYYAEDKLPEWVDKCNTYDEYIAFYDNDKYKARFFLIDVFDTFSNEDSEVKEILEWYFPCFDSPFDETDCNYCHQKHSDKCKKVQKIKTTEELLKLVDAKIIVSSECGYIPDYIVSKLSEISNLYCNHMG